MIVFIGGTFPDDKIESIVNNSKSTVQFAADNLQKLILKGISKLYKDDIYLINSIFVGSYPNLYRDLKVKDNDFVMDNVTTLNASFINIKGYKLFSRFLNVFKCLLKIKQKENKMDVVIYSMHLPFILSALLYKLLYKKVKITLFVPDLPQFMNLSGNKRSFPSKVNEYLLFKLSRYIDKFVFLTQDMATHFEPKCDFIVIEGMVDSSTNVSDTIREDSARSKLPVVLYTGTLNREYGIGDLLESFKVLNSKLELWICGNGNTVDEINKLTEEFNNVKFFGQVSRERALELQRECDFLINPRRSDSEYTRYSFPSKIMEYYLSGKPVIMRRLAGIPDDYFDYCFCDEHNSVESLVETLTRAIESSEDERLRMGREAKRFIIENKSEYLQVEKLLTFIKY